MPSRHQHRQERGGKTCAKALVHCGLPTSQGKARKTLLLSEAYGLPGEPLRSWFESAGVWSIEVAATPGPTSPQGTRQEPWRTGIEPRLERDAHREQAQGVECHRGFGDQPLRAGSR